MLDASQIPAFPVPPSAVHQGVTMRDWFAANALQGIIAKGLEVRGDKALTQEDKDKEMVRRAYSLADEMVQSSDLLARSKSGQKVDATAEPKRGSSELQLADSASR